jgi:ABC-type branched-subunit amino acid transport system permease subunit
MRTRGLTVLLVAAGATLPIFIPWLKTPVILAINNGLAVLGVLVLIRAGQVSFGHAMYVCASGYAVAYAGRFFHLDGVVLILAGTLASIVLGALIGLFIVRYRAIFFGMLNVAFSMVLYSILVKFSTYTGGSDGMRVDRPPFAGFTFERSGFETTLLYVSICIAVLAALIVQRYFASASGQALAAIKTNETRLEYLGISARRVFWGGYVASAALCGLGGSIAALAQGLVTPETGYWVRSGELVFIAILGGSSQAIGAFLGAVVFEFVRLYAAAYVTGAWQLVLGTALIVIIFAAPSGLVGLVTRFGRGRAGGHAS